MTLKAKSQTSTLQTIKNNSTFFVGYFIILLLGFIVLSQIEHGDENLYFVRFRKSILDTLGAYATLLAEPIIISFWVGYFLFENYRKTVSLISAIGVMLIVVGASKVFFHHPRPALFFRELGRLDELVPVEGTEILTGYTSFPSGHTMAAFTIYTLLALYTKQKSISGVFFLILATSVAWSRMYLGHHFLKDVIAGSISGVIIALIIFQLFEKLKNRPKWNRGFMQK